MSIPTPVLIIDYELAFGRNLLEDRLSLIKNIPQRHLFFEIAALNYRLKPKGKVGADTSLKAQIRELNYFTRSSQELFTKYITIFNRYRRNDTEYPLIFTRQTCLFAIEEIINSPIEFAPYTEEFKLTRNEVLDSILQYFLSVNFAITKIKEEKNKDNINFETLNPKLIPLNELTLENDQIYTPFRGYHLIKYFEQLPEFSALINSYFKDTYDIEPDRFIYEIMNMYLGNKHEIEHLNFCYNINNKQSKEIFEKFSTRISNTEIIKLISIRKSPFIKLSDNQFILTDNILLIEKSYNQFLNDFWFDCVKKYTSENGKTKINYSLYRSYFGYFFEDYLKKLLHNTFKKYKNCKLLLFDELIVTRGKNKIEIADIYLRYGKNILLGQVKSSSIYDIEKYGGDIDTLYKNDREIFFITFGLQQIVDAISNMDNYMLSLDNQFPKGHTYEIFPCIIVNDKALQTPFMAQTFNMRFNELLLNVATIKKVKINPLTLIHISDLERLDNHLHLNPKNIWEILKFNFRNKKFIPPFFNTVDRKIDSRVYSSRVTDLYNHLIQKYNPSIPNKEELI